MKATEQCFHVPMLTMLYNEVLSFSGVWINTSIILVVSLDPRTGHGDKTSGAGWRSYSNYSHLS